MDDSGERANNEYEAGERSDDSMAGDDGRTGRVLPFPSLGRRSTDTATEEPTADPRLCEVIGIVIRQERLAQNRTLADVASTAAVSLPYLSEVERGAKEASSDVVAAICESLGLPLDDLLERSARHLRHGRGGSGIKLLAA